MTADPSIVYYRFVPVLNRGQPTLAPVAYRLLQAGHRLSEWRIARDRIAAAWEGKHPTPRAPWGEDLPTDFGIMMEDIVGPGIESRNELTFLASECINHVRTSLDYLAFNVVWKDRGAPYAHTKFPLHTKESGYGEVRRKNLPGLTADHKAWFEAVQPFRGVEWTTVLEELSNRDKHTTAVDIVESYGFKLNKDAVFSDPLGDPRFRGFQVDDPSISYLIADAFASLENEPRLDAERTLDAILVGACLFANQFMVEWGYSPIQLARQ